ncbi:hypothetical protein ACET3Z_007251 [Daucus carota]
MEKEGPIFRDIRRYYCEYCGICRSKKSLISSHVLSHHQDKVNEIKADDNGEKEGLKSNFCDDCGLSFRKPAHLKQHVQSHSLEGYMFLQLVTNGNKLDVRVKHWIPQKNSKMREASLFTLNGLVSGL